MKGTRTGVTMFTWMLISEHAIASRDSQKYLIVQIISGMTGGDSSFRKKEIF